jgi:D-psicose/D-tagatose/L-ribulose 3-epimerase
VPDHPLKLALCNEVIREMSFADQCQFAVDLGYDGLEIAPFTLSPKPAALSTASRRSLRRVAEHAGIDIVGLHWLLMTPQGLSLTSDDATMAQRTRAHMLDMVDLCADLGGRILVHGSPAQRALADAASAGQARDIAIGHLRAAGQRAEARGVIYCLEPLAPKATDFITSVAEAVALIKHADTPGLATMIDTHAAWLGEDAPPQDIVREFAQQGFIRHVHVNETNRKAPGQGDHSFLPLIQALINCNYVGFVSVEPFEYEPSGAVAAGVAIEYLRSQMKALSR